MHRRNELKIPSIPHLVHIETTYSCNAACIFCYNPSRQLIVDYEKLDKIIEEVKKSEIPHIYLIGGEPSLLDINKINSYVEKLHPVSSITIVTNGIKFMEGLNKEIACVGVSFHGDEEMHEGLNNIKGSYKKTINSIKKYVSEGFDVRAISVLCSRNYDQMYAIIKKAYNLGMESIYIDMYEAGGIGSYSAQKLTPSMEQIKEAITQIIKAKKDFDFPIGFGTAIPFCLDKRLVEEDLIAQCGAGTTFAAINPEGGVRICNQSQIIMGNIINESMESIWAKKELSQFRNLKWMTSPCSECALKHTCVGGCKVDATCGKAFSCDRIIHGKKPFDIKEIPKKKIDTSYPKEYREFKINKYAKLNTAHKEDYITTRYQTVEIDHLGVEIIESIISNEFTNEKQVINEFNKSVPKDKMRKFISKLFKIGAIDVNNK